MYSSQELLGDQGRDSSVQLHRREDTDAESPWDSGLHGADFVPVTASVVPRWRGVAHRVCNRDLSPDLKSRGKIRLDALPEGFGAERASFSEQLWLWRTDIFVC